MTHLLMYANRFDLEGLIACSGKYLHADRTDGRVVVHPELFHRLVDGYEKVVENLKKHESGWPTAAHLLMFEADSETETWIDPMTVH